MRTLLATTFLFTPFMAFAQTPDVIFQEGASHLGEMGIQLNVEGMRSSGSGMVFSGVTFYPSDNRTWSVSIPAMSMTIDGQRAVLDPEGEISVEVDFPWFIEPIEFAVNDDNLALNVFIDMAVGELRGFEVLADEVRIESTGEFAQEMGLSFSGTVNDLVLRENEFSSVEMTQEVSWGGVSMLMSAGAPDRETGEMMVDLGPFEMTVETMQAGLLEEFPWVAAVGAGMKVTAQGEMSRSGVTTMVRAPGDSAPSVQRYELGRLNFEIDQGDVSSVEVSVLSPSVRYEKPETAEFTVRADEVAGSIAGPLHQSVTAVSSPADLTVKGGEVTSGEQVWPFSLEAGVEASILPVIDWFDYSIVTKEENWRHHTRVFALQSLSFDESKMTVGEDEYTLSGQLNAVDPKSFGLKKDMEGDVRVRANSTSNLLSLLGESGLFDQYKNAIALGVLKGIFGEDAGLSGGEVTFTFEQGDSVQRTVSQP